MSTRLMDLTAGVPGLEHHERPDYQDRVELTRADRWALVNPFNPLSWTIGSVVQLASVTALFGTVHPVLLLLPLAGLPSVVATMRAQRQWLRLRESQAESNRVLRHLQDLITQLSAAKEIRIFGLTDELLRRRRALFFDLEHARLRQSIRATSLTTLGWLFFSACFVAALAFTVDLVQRGEATVGSVVLVLGLGASINLQLSILAWNAAWLIRTHGSVVNLLWLRDYADGARRAVRPERPVPTPKTLRDGIRFQDVSFHYAGIDRPVLDHVDLFLPAGSTIAIVGENGAGKTTLVKLLNRFYEPTGGAILVDGQDLAWFPVDEWRQRLAAGFQDFARLQLLARESIGVGDLARADGTRRADRGRADARRRARPAVDAAVGARDPARTRVRRRRRPVGRAVAEGRAGPGDDARGGAVADARRADREPRRADRTRAVRTLRAGRTRLRARRRRDHDPGQPPLLDGPHG